MPFRTRAASGTFAAILLTAAVTSQAAGADRGFTNYDGDTFRATFRIENIDTP